ncbi:MAG: hypothetical protein IPM35_28225 [Myxococcales bacterium]|nr:hypothetical protein [Myxococcales bacterium]
MLDSVLTQLVAPAVAEAQRLLVAELATVRAELAAVCREPGKLHGEPERGWR